MLSRWLCTHCGEIYDESVGASDISPGTRFEDLPDDWVCPICSADKAAFILLEDD